MISEDFTREGKQLCPTVTELDLDPHLCPSREEENSEMEEMRLVFALSPNNLRSYAWLEKSCSLNSGPLLWTRNMNPSSQMSPVHRIGGSISKVSFDSPTVLHLWGHFPDPAPLIFHLNNGRIFLTGVQFSTFAPFIQFIFHTEARSIFFFLNLYWTVLFSCLKTCISVHCT